MLLMRKFVSVLVFLFYLSVPAQQETNPFAAAENENNETGTREGGQGPAQTSTADEDSPGNPADPTPVDDYIPLLLLTGVGIIVYTTYRKKQMTKS